VEEEHIVTIAHLLKTMSHPIRLKILCLLQDQERTVGQLREEVKTTNANVSQHLAILRNQGIVSSRKDANFMYNRIGDERILQLIQSLRDLYCQ
jgi:DNA-binding transcriptional ArsR family regulator